MQRKTEDLQQENGMLKEGLENKQKLEKEIEEARKVKEMYESEMKEKEMISVRNWVGEMV